MNESNLHATGVYATKEQHDQVRDAYMLDYGLPIMATLPGGQVPRSPEDYRDMANRFARENGLPAGKYAINPGTREFFQLETPAAERADQA